MTERSTAGRAGIDHRARWTFGIVSVAWFAFALDRLVVSTALPVIRTDLEAAAGGLSWADLEWTVNAYTLSFACLLITGAAFGDRFGRRRMFLLGLAVFTTGSAGAALAPSVEALVVARVVQGVGGAIFLPLTLTMLSAVTPAERRGAVLGAWGAIGGLGATLGPLVEGALAGGAGWRWIFWLNVPLGLVLLPLARRHLDESYGRKARLDAPGAVLSSLGLFAVVWAAIRAESAGWGSVAVLAALLGGVLALALFVGWERRCGAPMLPPHFFASRVFTMSGLAALAMYAALFGTLFLAAQLLQMGLGYTPLQAGVRTLPMAVMPMLLAPIGGRLSDRYGFRPVMVVGLGTVTAGLAWLAVTVTPGGDYVLLVPGLALAGGGSGLFFAPLSAAVLSSVQPDEQGQASGAASAIREVAVVIGVTVLGLVFAARGGYDSGAQFVAGFVPAMWWGAGLALAGVFAALALPRRRAAGVSAERRSIAVSPVPGSAGARATLPAIHDPSQRPRPILATGEPGARDRPGRACLSAVRP